MRSYRPFGLFVVGLVSVCAFTANAHPRKAHYHPASCVLGQVTGSGTPTLTYGSMSATVGGTNTKIVCPMEQLLFDTYDPGTGGDLYAIMTVEVPYSASSSQSCDLQTESGAHTFVSIPTTGTFPGSGAAGNVMGQGTFTMPGIATSIPVALRLQCDLKVGTQIGGLELEID